MRSVLVSAIFLISSAAQAYCPIPEMASMNHAHFDYEMSGGCEHTEEVDAQGKYVETHLSTIYHPLVGDESLAYVPSCPWSHDYIVFHFDADCNMKRVPIEQWDERQRKPRLHRTDYMNCTSIAFDSAPGGMVCNHAGDEYNYQIYNYRYEQGIMRLIAHDRLAAHPDPRNIPTVQLQFYRRGD